MALPEPVPVQPVQERVRTPAPQRRGPAEVLRPVEQRPEPAVARVVASPPALDRAWPRSLRAPAAGLASRLAFRRRRSVAEPVCDRAAEAVEPLTAAECLARAPRVPGPAQTLALHQPSTRLRRRPRDQSRGQPVVPSGSTRARRRPRVQSRGQPVVPSVSTLAQRRPRVQSRGQPAACSVRRQQEPLRISAPRRPTTIRPALVGSKGFPARQIGPGFASENRP